MAEKRARLNLARAAAHLAAGARPNLPPLVLMTDDDRLPDPVAAAQALPRGSMVVVRARDGERRAMLTASILRNARARHLTVLVADDALLAARLGADGLHLPELRAYQAAHWRALHPRWLITASSHGAAPIPDAVDAVFLSPVFATKSHEGRVALEAVKASFIARRLMKPAYALGGVTDRKVLRLAPVFVGIAAIGALSV